MERILTREWLTYALLASLPFERLPSLQIGGVTARLSILIGGLLLAVTVVKQPKVFIPDTGLKRWLLAFLVVCLVSSALSAHPARALAVTIFTGYCVALALAVSSVVGELDLKRAWRWLLVSTIAVCGFGLYQFVGDLAGLPNNLTGLKPAYSSQVFGFPRVQSTALEPLYLANFLLLPLSLGLALTLKGRPGTHWLLPMIYTVFFLTLSRGGVAAAIVLTLAMLIVCGFKRRWTAAGRVAASAVIGGVVSYVMLLIVVPALTQWRGQPVEQAASTHARQLTNLEIGNSSVDRAKTRQLAVELFRLHPVVGAGPGTFGYFANQRSPVFPTTQIANNQPLELLAETGLAGFTVLAAFAVALLAGAIKWLHRRTVDGQWAWAVGVLGFLVASGIQYWSFSTLYITHLWVAMGLLIGLIRVKTEPKSDS
jgi:hypothetical protein